MRDIHISSSNHPALLPSWATAFPAGRFRSVSAQFDQQHTGQLAQQTRETLRNLASVMVSATGEAMTDGHDPDLDAQLSTFRALRVYYPRAADRPAIDGLLAQRFPATCRIEFAQALLCRPELLIEIEGLAMPQRRTKAPSVAPAEQP